MTPQPRPFRGSTILARGLLTHAVLYGPRYKRLFPDIHVAADAEENLTLLSMAAHELVAPHGVLAGYSAAEILGASCAPLGAPAEVIMMDGPRRTSTPRLTVHRDGIDSRHLTTAMGMRLTTPACTAGHLARWAPTPTEAVVAVDALSFRCGLDPSAVLSAPPGSRRVGRLRDVIRLAEPSSESPMETRIRLAIVLAGLPLPRLVGDAEPVDGCGDGGRRTPRPRHRRMITARWFRPEPQPLRARPVSGWNQPRTVRPTRWNSFRSL